MSTVFEMAMGVIIVAEAVAVPETWPKAVERNPVIIMMVRKRFFIELFFIICISCGSIWEKKALLSTALL